MLASGLGASLIRLQCYEGLDISQAVYEWNYARQLLEIRLMEAAGVVDRHKAARELFGEDFLIKRPLLQALSNGGERPPVLLIDELDRADEEFEGFLLELLADFQVTIPELGTIRAAVPPVVIITSNRTRELHDALKRRCLYFWIEYPDFEKELRIVTTKVPGAPARLAEQVTAFVQELRTADLYKAAGISETLDWVAALVALDRTELDPATIDQTLGLLLKNQEDIQAVRGERVSELLNRAQGRKMSALLPNLVHFGRLLRALGLDVHAGRMLDVAGALAHVDIGRRSDVYFTLRTLLIHRQQDLATFDEAFRVFWRPPPGDWSTDRSSGARRAAAVRRPARGHERRRFGRRGRRSAPARRWTRRRHELRIAGGPARQGLRAVHGGRDRARARR